MPGGQHLPPPRSAPAAGPGAQRARTGGAVPAPLFSAELAGKCGLLPRREGARPRGQCCREGAEVAALPGHRGLGGLGLEGRPQPCLAASPGASGAAAAVSGPGNNPAWGPLAGPSTSALGHGRREAGCSSGYRCTVNGPSSTRCCVV